MFDLLNDKGTYDPIIIKSVEMVHIHIKHVHVEFHRGNKLLS